MEKKNLSYRCVWGTVRTDHARTTGMHFINHQQIWYFYNNSLVVHENPRDIEYSPRASVRLHYNFNMGWHGMQTLFITAYDSLLLFLPRYSVDALAINAARVRAWPMISPYSIDRIETASNWPTSKADPIVGSRGGWISSELEPIEII